MVEIRIICVGKISKRYFKQALEEYYKRLGAFCSLKIIEVKEERLTPTKTVEQVIEAESARIEQKLRGAYTVALDSRGKEMTSVDFSRLIGERVNRGEKIDFIIGGSHGLSESLLKRASLVLSFSEMTFPHQLFRVMLSEQLYRAFSILNHQQYHK